MASGEVSLQLGPALKDLTAGGASAHCLPAAGVQGAPDIAPPRLSHCAQAWLKAFDGSQCSLYARPSQSLTSGLSFC